MDCLTNRTFDEIQLNESASAMRTLSQKDIELFTMLVSADFNPAQIGEVYATADMLQQVVAPSLWSGVLISWVLGTRLPGPGSVYRGQNLRFHKPMRVGDTLRITLTVVEKNPADHCLTLECRCLDRHDQVVISGAVWIEAPTAKLCSPPVELSIVLFAEHGARHKKLVEMAASREPATAAVVHPVDAVSLQGALRAAEAGLIRPLLVGPRAKILAAAEAAALALTTDSIVDVPHSHAAAARAVELVHQGCAEMLLKGSLHTDELIAEVVKPTTGLRTERRISHVYVMDVPTYPKPLLITDAAINIFPDLCDKRDIVQNAIDLAQVIGVMQPKVAILSAVETVTPKLTATTDAAALCKMAERGQITGGILDGPLAFDNAISKRAAQTKNILSAVAGEADILVVPDLEAGNMLAKQLEYLANASTAGIVVGARVPIALTSRADDILARMASCAVAMLMVHRKRELLNALVVK